MAKVGGNPQNFKNPDKKFSGQPLAVRVEMDLYEYVRSLPNSTEWLRNVIAEAVKREQNEQAT